VSLDLECQQVGQRVGEEEREERHPERDAGREEDRVRIELGAEQALVVLERQLVGDDAASEAPE